MNISPTIDLHPENHFQFAPDTDSKGCCCCWKSKSIKEFHVNQNLELEKNRKSQETIKARIISNQRLGNLVKGKLGKDAIENEIMFEKLCNRINQNFQDDERVTHERLILIINEIHNMKKEFEV